MILLLRKPVWVNVEGILPHCVRESVSDRLRILLLKLKGYRKCKIGTVKGELQVLNTKSSSEKNYWMNLSHVATEHLTSLTFCGFPVFEHDLTLNS